MADGAKQNISSSPAAGPMLSPPAMTVLPMQAGTHSSALVPISVHAGPEYRAYAALLSSSRPSALCDLSSPTAAHTESSPEVGKDFLIYRSDKNQSMRPVTPAAEGDVIDERLSDGSIKEAAANMVAPPASGGEIGESEVDSAGSVKEVNPWSKEYTPEHHVLTTPAARDYLYTWLLRCGVRMLADLSRQVNVKDTGWKNTLVCRLIMHADARVRDSSVPYESVFGNDYTAFWRSPKSQSITLYIAPSAEILQDTAPVEGKRGRTAKKAAPSMSTSEFGRLMGVLIEDDDARAALISSGQDLTREQQQRREGRDVSWTTIVEHVFNDTSFKIALDFKGCVAGDDELSTADPNAKPLSFRSGVWLKDQFFLVRGLFTRGYDRWSRSGQNDGEGNDFHLFVPRAPNSTSLSSQGRHVCIMFHALRCGRRGEDTELLNVSCKLAPGGAGYDDEGVDIRGGAQRKKRKKQEEAVEAATRRDEKLSTLSDALVAYIKSDTEGTGQSSVDSAGSGNATLKEQFTAPVELLNNIAALTKQRAEIQRMCSEGDAFTSKTVKLLEKALVQMQTKLDTVLADDRG